MYCWNCGKEIEEKSVFCPYCGIKQAGAEKPPKVNRKSMLLPVICAAICVVSSVGMFLMLTGDKENPAPPAITQEKAEPETTKATQPEEKEESKKETAKESKVDPYNAELPDLASFLDTEYTQDEWGYTHYVTCLVDRDDKDDIVEAVLDLLQEPRYQLDMMDKDSDSDGTHYTFEYTGKNDDIDWVYLKAGGKYHVKLTVKPYGSSQTALILYSFPEFYLEDPGKRADISASSETSDDPKPSSGEKKSCGAYFCDNGRCDNCNGNGRVQKHNANGFYYEDCWACISGSCIECGGDLKKD